MRCEITYDIIYKIVASLFLNDLDASNRVRRQRMRFDHITELAKKYVEYDMISTHTELPDFPAPRVHLLYSFLTDSETGSQKSVENCALAAFLVQSGMDTHDQIDLGGEQQESKMRARQLKVLAGDYFSSVFYALLAATGKSTWCLR